MPPLTFTALDTIPEIAPGDDLAHTIALALHANARTLNERDVVVVAQKIVSKSERRYVNLADVQPSARALELGSRCQKDARIVELVLRESSAVLRCVKDVLIVRHKLGFVVANAGVDQSNIEGATERALLLPENPDASAERIRAALSARFGLTIAVLISDSFGRAWRMGVCGTCIGCAGLNPLLDKRGQKDRFGRALRVTQIAVADEIAAAAALVMGEADEGRPVAIVSGLAPEYFENAAPARRLVRPMEQDLFT